MLSVASFNGFGTTPVDLAAFAPSIDFAHYGLSRHSLQPAMSMHENIQSSKKSNKMVKVSLLSDQCYTHLVSLPPAMFGTGSEIIQYQ